MKRRKNKKNNLLNKREPYVIATKKKINKESKKSEISFDVTIDLIIKILCIISMLFLFFKISIKSKKKIILKRNNNNFLKRNNNNFLKRNNKLIMKTFLLVSLEWVKKKINI